MEILFNARVYKLPLLMFYRFSLGTRRNGERHDYKTANGVTVIDK